MTITLTIPEASPSLNQVIRMHWAKRKRCKADWAAMIAAEIMAVRRSFPGLELRATGRRYLLIERYGKRSLDPDNLVGGAKEVITDNLRHFGLLLDDTDRTVQIEARNMHGTNGERTREPFTRITLQDI